VIQGPADLLRIRHCPALDQAIVVLAFTGWMDGGGKITPPEGKSLLPAFANRPIERGYLAWEHERNRAVRAGKWKLVATRSGGWELYDLDADRNEMTALAAKHPDAMKELAAQ
jgi:arylsulfatase